MEGVNLDIYQPKKSKFDLEAIEEEFAFLFVGHWMQGDLGEDRKNVGLLVRLFLEAFKNKKKIPALILKTTQLGTSCMDRNEILRKIDAIRNTVPDARTLPNIYLLQGEFLDTEINELYNHKKVKAMVNLTKGEGFGRPLLEFSLTKKPIISTNWSGHTDFLSEDFTSLLPGELTQVHPSSVVKDVIMPEFKWFSVDHNAVIFALRDMFTNYKKYKEKSVRQAYKSKTDFSFAKMVEQLKNHLDKYVPEIPMEVPLQLPKLNLPKLKKLENAER